MMEKQALILQQTSAFVQKDFEIEYIPEDVTEEELIDFLEQFVQNLLDTNMKQLFYLLYRLDINEHKVHKALNPAAIELPHKAVAQLIFHREKQKAKTRIEYNERYEEEGDGWND